MSQQTNLNYTELQGVRTFTKKLSLQAHIIRDDVKISLSIQLPITS